MMVGPSGSGKSFAWKVLLKALERLEGVEGVSHVIDPKVSCYFVCCFYSVVVVFTQVMPVQETCRSLMMK